jgi:hypothetical protein
MITRMIAAVATVFLAAAIAVWEQPATATTTPAPFTARVYATREGLIGQLTANGHVIGSADLFAALPSRLGLSGLNTGERSVQVCTGGRCVFLPVWDVGPWNTKDDYWNTARQAYKDLPRGVPAAQAAYLKGYNRGRDEFGRVVRNPAGLDLSDRAFSAGLALRDNAWVQVTYLWTGGGPQGTVTTNGDPLLVRSSPSTSGRIIGYAAAAARVPVMCQLRGQKISGNVRSTDQWNRVAPGMYVSHAFVKTAAGFTAPACL